MWGSKVTHSDKHVCNLSDYPLDDHTIHHLEKGLSFIPKLRFENRVLLRREIEDFICKLCLRYMFREAERSVPELYRKTGYNPGTSASPTLENLIEKIRESLFLLVNKRGKPEGNLCLRMQRALRALMYLQAHDPIGSLLLPFHLRSAPRLGSWSKTMGPPSCITCHHGAILLHYLSSWSHPPALPVIMEPPSCITCHHGATLLHYLSSWSHPPALLTEH